MLDALYGSGLRQTMPRTAAATRIPNGGACRHTTRSTSARNKVSSSTQTSLLKARLDVVNVTDNIYELRNGSGVGVNAAQYGERLGFFGSLSYVF